MTSRCSHSKSLHVAIRTYKGVKDIVGCSITTLNNWTMVKIYPNLKVEVGASIPGCKISSPVIEDIFDHHRLRS